MMEGMKKLILYPFNGAAREALGVVEAINRVEPVWDVIGFADDDPNRTGEALGTCPVLGTREVLAQYPEAGVLAVPGRPDDFWRRTKLIASLGVAPERFVSLVHPSVSVGPGCVLGPNTVLMAGVVLTASVTVGADVAVLPNTVLSHDVNVGAGSLVGAGVVVAGGVQIGERCYIGSGARILQDVIIGEETLVGLGSTILHSVPPRTVVAGNPARMLRSIPSDH